MSTVLGYWLIFLSPALLLQVQESLPGAMVLAVHGEQMGKELIRALLHLRQMPLLPMWVSLCPGISC